MNSVPYYLNMIRYGGALSHPVNAHQAHKETFSVQGYAKGAYILSVQSDTELKVLKIIVY